MKIDIVLHLEVVENHPDFAKHPDIILFLRRIARDAVAAETQTGPVWIENASISEATGEPAPTTDDEPICSVCNDQGENCPFCWIA